MALAAILAAAPLGAASAQGLGEAPAPLVVVELYSSQGCSSCPPADDLFHRLAQQENVLPLALHVDYWDYIGWADTFAQPGFTDRQRAYAHMEGTKTVYTPQIIVGGRDRLMGVPEMELAQIIAVHSDLEALFLVTLERRGDRVAIRAERAPGATPTALLASGSGREILVQLIRYKPEETVDIEAGENAGHSITYTNVVTDWREVARWTGEAPFELVVPAPGSLPVAVILQEPGPGPILAAAVLR
jgi:hypothetical protein